MARLKDKYLSLKPELQAELGIKNPMQIPSLDKVVISVGAGFAMKDNKLIQNIENTITTIAGQKASTIIAKKSAVAHLKSFKNNLLKPRPSFTHSKYFFQTLHLLLAGVENQAIS